MASTYESMVFEDRRTGKWCVEIYEREAGNKVCVACEYLPHRHTAEERAVALCDSFAARAKVEPTSEPVSIPVLDVPAAADDEPTSCKRRVKKKPAGPVLVNRTAI